MKIKLVASIIVFLFFVSLLIPSNVVSSVNDQNTRKGTGSESQMVTVFTTQYGKNKILFFTGSVENISLDDANQIKEKFLSIEQNFSGSEKIKKQLQIMHEIGIISSNLTFDLLLSMIEKINNSYRSRLFNTGVNGVFIRPTIVSHFTLNGRISCVLPIRKTLFSGQIIDEDCVNGFAGFLPWYLGVSYDAVYITAISYKSQGSYDKVFSRFNELLIPCIGMSIAFIDNTNASDPDVLFEYNLDICKMGVLWGK
jgi:hypothetical protein